MNKTRKKVPVHFFGKSNIYLIILEIEMRKLEYEKLQYILFSMPYCISHNYKALWPFSTIYQKISSCLFVLEGILCTLVLLQCSSSVIMAEKLKSLQGHHGITR